tara:strand:+ start:66 stop:245 length:180 start_codon:yes stop_codon:yes gene_type:complete
MITNIKNWIKGRLSERTTLDGVLLISVGVVGLFLSTFIPMYLVFWAAIAYGAWTLYKSE